MLLTSLTGFSVPESQSFEVFCEGQNYSSLSLVFLVFFKISWRRRTFRLFKHTDVLLVPKSAIGDLDCVVFYRWSSLGYYFVLTMKYGPVPQARYDETIHHGNKTEHFINRFAKDRFYERSPTAVAPMPMLEITRMNSFDTCPFPTSCHCPSVFSFLNQYNYQSIPVFLYLFLLVV